VAKTTMKGCLLKNVIVSELKKRVLRNKKTITVNLSDVTLPEKDIESLKAFFSGTNKLKVKLANIEFTGSLGLSKDYT
jgi:hypothetical protein